MKQVKQIKSWFKYNFEFLRVLNSPFRRLKFTWYFGKIAIGTPYFLPRKWVKKTYQEIKDEFTDWYYKEFLLKDIIPEVNRDDEWNKYYKKNENYQKAVPIKYFGINWVTLGWKTKYDNFRFEWNPLISFVIFGKQLVIGLKPKINKDCMDSIYWETWLYYYYKTKGKRKDRLKQLIEKHSCIWLNYKNPSELIYTNYYWDILKPKYLKLMKKEFDWNFRILDKDEIKK